MTSNIRDLIRDVMPPAELAAVYAAEAPTLAPVVELVSVQVDEDEERELQDVAGGRADETVAGYFARQARDVAASIDLAGPHAPRRPALRVLPPVRDAFALADVVKARHADGLRELRGLVDEARRTDVGVDEDDEEPLDRVELVRLLDDPATWERVWTVLRARGVELDDELVDQVRAAVRH